MNPLKRFALALVLSVASLQPGRVDAQAAEGVVRLRVVSEEIPIAGAVVRADSATTLTNSSGEATVRLPPGTHRITVTAPGYAEGSAEVLVRAALEVAVEIEMEVEAEELEEIIVSSTRMDRRIEDEPVRVEVLAREEIEEKLLMTPGDIAMMLNETSGLRVQNTSPSLGGANVRIHGLRGRYTQVLSDGLPLYGAQSGSMSMLQIPPMDLAQVEVIKGAASALYGATALGGVVNLISRRPKQDEREVLLNQSSLGTSDGILWLSDEVTARWGYTLLGSLHRQGMVDVDDDGWSDLPGYRRLVARPRVFWTDRSGRSAFVTLGTTLEDREGGTLRGRTTPAGSGFAEELETRRLDLGAVGRVLVGDDNLLSLRASGMAQRHQHRFGEDGEDDFHSTTFVEVAYSGAATGHSWLVGAALQRESYEAKDLQGFDFDYTIASAFAQDEYSPARWLTLAASGRLDHHGEHGLFLNPRVSLLLRPGAGWTARLSAGTGFFPPTVFTEEIEIVGLRRLLPPQGVEPELARSASVDLGRLFGNFELNATGFGSIVKHPVRVETVVDRLRLMNAEEPTRTWGGELLARWNGEPFHVTATYSHLRSTEAAPSGGGRRSVALTPSHTAGLVGIWEAEGRGRVGVELFYTGRQELEDNPYRSVSRPYAVTGVLVEWRFGRARLFANGENLLDARQTRHDPLVLPQRSPVGRWTTDAWAPLEGRAFNAGVRYEF